MRHLKKGRKFSRTSSHRKAMFRNMVTSLMRHERITTTIAKAKELRGVAARVITYGKKGLEAYQESQGASGAAAQQHLARAVHNRRLAAKFINDSEVLHEVFTTYAQRFQNRPGGYTRIVRIGPRRGDGAEMAIIELIPGDEATTRRRGAEGAGTGPVTSKESFGESAG